MTKKELLQYMEDADLETRFIEEMMPLINKMFSDNLPEELIDGLIEHAKKTIDEQIELQSIFGKHKQIPKTLPATQRAIKTLTKSTNKLKETMSNFKLNLLIYKGKNDKTIN